MPRLFVLTLSIILSIGFGCSPLIASGQEDSAAEESTTFTPEPVVVVSTPTATYVPELLEATYRDAGNNFEFDYPAGWAFDSGEQHARGSYVQFYSWNWQPGEAVETIPSGETVLSVTVNSWEPKNDLEAFIDQRKLAWDTSGISILSEEHIYLEAERPAAQFTVQSVDGAQAFFLFTTIGEQYLTLGGNGELGLLANIGHTLRLIQ